MAKFVVNLGKVVLADGGEGIGEIQDIAFSRKFGGPNAEQEARVWAVEWAAQLDLDNRGEDWWYRGDEGQAVLALWVDEV